MKITNKIETGATPSDLKIKIRQTRLSTMIWPAVILAKRRIISANGFEKIPIISTGIITGKKPERHTRSCKNMTPVILVSAELCNKKCKYCQYECHCYISCNICSERRRKRDKSHQVVYKYEKENRQKIGHIFFILVLSDIGNCNIIAYKKNYWFEKALNSFWVAYSCFFIGSCKRKEQQQAN